MMALTAHQISRGVFSKDGAGMIFIIEILVTIFRKGFLTFMGSLVIVKNLMALKVVHFVLGVLIEEEMQMMEDIILTSTLQDVPGYTEILLLFNHALLLYAT